MNDKLVDKSEAVEWPELHRRFEMHRIEEITFSRDATPAEMYAVARLLCGDPVPGVGEDATLDTVAQLTNVTVQVRVASSVFDALAFEAEQAAFAADAGTLADRFSKLVARERALTDPETQRACGRAMRRLTKPTTLRLVAQLLVTDPPRGVQVIQLLERCGQDGVDAVVDQYLGARTGAARALLLEVLKRLPAARESLVLMLSDPRGFMVCHAVDLLGEFGGDEVTKAEIGLLRHDNRRVRRAAVRALARNEDSGVVDALLSSLVDGDVSVRLEAVEALATRGASRVSAQIGAALAVENNPEVLHALIAALARHGSPDAVQRLAAAVARRGALKQLKHPGLRAAAVMALGDIPLPSALAALKGLANDRDKDVRDAVARVLSVHRPSAA